MLPRVAGGCSSRLGLACWSVAEPDLQVDARVRVGGARSCTLGKEEMDAHLDLILITEREMHWKSITKGRLGTSSLLHWLPSHSKEKTTARATHQAAISLASLPFRDHAIQKTDKPRRRR